MSTTKDLESLAKLWQAASEQEIGICIKVHPDDQRKLVMDLYRIKPLGAYDNLMIAQPQPPGTIFITKETIPEVPK